MEGARSPRKRRPSLLLGGASKAGREEYLFECFFVIGMNDDKTPQTIFQYPNDEKFSYEGEILCFGLPEGNQNRELRRSASGSSLNAILFGQLSNLERSSNSYIFVLNTGEKLLYGVCVHSEELLDSLPSFIAQPNISSSKSTFKSGLRSYCVVSQYPFFSAHFGVLYAILANERLQMLQCATDFLSPPTPRSGKQRAQFNSLRGLGHKKVKNPITKSGVRYETEEQNYTIQLLSEYRHAILPVASQSIKLSLGSEPTCEITISSGSDLQLISQWAIPCLFRAMSLKDIFSFYVAALVETNVMIISRSPGVLSGVILSVIPLIYPLVWQGPLITILPSSLSEILESPVPLITGMKEKPQCVNLADWNDPLIIDLNSNTVTLPSKKKLPKLPNQKVLMAEVGEIYQTFQDTRNSSNILRTCSSAEREAVDKTMDTFRRYNTTLLDNDLFKLVTDPQTSELSPSRESVFRVFPRKHQAFMKQFIKTQQFSVHALEIKSEIEEQTEEMGTTLSKLDKMIAEATSERGFLLNEIQKFNRDLRQVETRLATLQASRARLRDDAIPSKSPKLKRNIHRRNKSLFT